MRTPEENNDADVESSVDAEREADIQQTVNNVMELYEEKGITLRDVVERQVRRSEGGGD